MKLSIASVVLPLSKTILTANFIDNRKKATAFILSVLIILVTTVEICWSDNNPDIWINFDNLPATAGDDIPGSGGEWLYTTATQNPDKSYGMTAYDRAGWRSSQSYQDRSNVYNYFSLYPNYYYSDHMGWPTYGYLEIDDQVAIKGNSLRYRVTGGVNGVTCPCGKDEVCSSGEVYSCNLLGLQCVEGASVPCKGNGLEVTTKQHYLDYIEKGMEPIAGGAKIGSPTVYFMNTGPNPSSSGQEAVPFKEAGGNNRLSMYVRLPPQKSNHVDNIIDARETPADTFHIGPFNDVGGHWYHVYNLQGGGWIHVLVDGHPQHNNSFHSASLYPYPSSSVRDMGYGYFATIYRWYFSVVNPYGYTAEAPYSVWLDEIEFYNDTEPQNNETINSPAVGYYPERRVFEIGFQDKYANNQYSYSTYEVRYSFDQITNKNWLQATPVHIQADERINYGIAENKSGKFEKMNSYYRSVWASFRLANKEDEERLKPGAKIYFAIKDISQVGGNGPVPVDGHNIYGSWAEGAGGRDYQNHGEVFDFTGDSKVLNLVKRIDYTFPGVAQIQPVSPLNFLPAILSTNKEKEAP